MSVSIKVAVRCRPFTIDDDLGVSLVQNNEEEGEINILNSSYSTTRFAFTYAWWSAFGFPRHVKKNASEAEGMKLIDQQEVYNSIGKRIKTDVLTGNAVVMFAYGLSGSGKTFTVFGPDAVEEPEAWFKHGKPHPLWGIFPRLAYEVFQAKEDGWKITMKYFQNVVDTVRDLMSPVGKEMHYKNGMKKDQDGFTDIEWCCSAVLNSWDDLRKMFKAANARKAIAPTQFNHQSTRGHCIMVLEVETPHPDTAGLKQRGRIYVCDLAGTEPAGDIVYARYEKQIFEGGEIEHRYIGPHNETNKTKELQEQGKKINLSLSEMAQFFMKMAEAIQSRTLKPGHSIPGCNSYFLCKYLKDTMLQARTYLFCAIRPEVTYHKYTFSTLGFAKNASVIKLKPKMATVMATAAEKKLMAELEQMKRLVEQLRKGQGQLVAAPKPQTTIPVHAPADHTSEEPKSKAEEPKISKDESAEAAVDPHPEESQESRKRRKSITKNADQVSHIQEMLEAKQMQLREVLSGGTGSDQGPTPEEKELLRQREEYARRGISLSHFEADTRLPHLVNVDEDPFRHNRFVYVLKKRITVFGPQGDVQPMSLSVQRKHCATEVKKGEAGAKGTVILIGGRGDVWHNGKPVRKQEKVVLSQHDRVAIGAELLLFRWKAFDTPETGPPPTAEEAVTEFKRAMKASSGRRRSAELHAMEEQLKTLQEAKAKAEEEARSAIAGKAEIREKEQWTTPFHTQPLDDDHIASVMRSAEDDVQMLLPHVKEMEQFMHLFGREYITFDITLQRSQGEAFEVAASVQVKNERTRQACYISSFEFLEHRSIFQAEVAELQAALDNEREYSVPAEHDPGLRLLQGTHQLGVATLFTEPIVYMMAVEDEEGLSVVKNVRAPYGEVGKLESSWHPLVLDADGRTLDPEEDEDCAIELPEIDTPMDLVGKSWAYRFEIKMASGLPLTCASAYCQYDLLGEAFTTETVQPDPPSTLPVFHYSFVHKVDEVTQDIVQHLCKPLNVYLYVGPHVEPEKPEDNISTKNPRVVERFESLRQPNTPVPTASPSGRSTSPIRSPQLKGNGESSSNIDVGPLSSWGFAAPDVCLEGFEETQGGDTMTVELSRLRTENALLKKELKTAREEIDRLTRGRAGGVMTSASTSVLPDREGLVLDKMNEGKMVEVNGRSHVVNDGTPREIKSRKEIDIDTARLTDAAVEAAIGEAR